MKRPVSLICFIGIDGSGKSTQADLLVQWLSARGIKALYVWSGGDVMGIRRFLLFLSKKLVKGSSRKGAAHEDSSGGGQAAQNEHRSRRSKLMRFLPVRMLWSFAAYTEHLVEINREVRGNIQHGYFVVCDRYRWDSLIDLAVLNDRDPKWLVNRLNRFMWRFIPKPAMTFIIDVPPEEAMQRAVKRNYNIPSLEDIKRRSMHYQWLAKNETSVTVINGCRDVAAIQADIINVVQKHLGEEMAI